MKNKDFKQLFDDELSNLVVTERLKQQTLDKIYSPKRRIFHNFFNVKLSILSSLIVIFIMGLNLFIPKGWDNQVANTYNINNQRDILPDQEKYSPGLKTTTTTTTTDNQK